jgi:hypothetical protein
MRHEWTDGQYRWGADSEVGATLNGEPVNEESVSSWPEEMLCLAQRIKELEETEASLRDSYTRYVEGASARVAELEAENQRLRDELEETEILLASAENEAMHGYQRD